MSVSSTTLCLNWISNTGFGFSTGEGCSHVPTASAVSVFVKGGEDVVGVLQIHAGVVHLRGHGLLLLVVARSVHPSFGRRRPRGRSADSRLDVLDRWSA